MRDSSGEKTFEGNRSFPSANDGLRKKPLPLQGAHRLASQCRFAGGRHVARIPRHAPSYAKFAQHFTVKNTPS